MVILPAFCNDCGSVVPSGFSIENSTNLSFKSCSTYCQACGGVAHIPDGVYDFIDNAIQIIAAPKTSIYELNKLKIVFEKYEFKAVRDDNLDLNELVETIREKIPSKTDLAELILSKSKNDNSKVMFWLTLAGLIIATVLALPGSINSTLDLQERLSRSKPTLIEEAVRKCTDSSNASKGKAKPSQKRHSKGFGSSLKQKKR